MDVNLEELDQIIDGGMRAPLSESDGEKLKAVLHILAERAKPRWRTTEKTRAVLPPPPTTGSEPAAEKPSPEGERQPTGHGRNGAVRFTGARIVTVAHKTLHPGDACPECGVGRVYHQKQPKTLVRIVGRPPLEATRYEMERLRCNGCGEVFTAEEPAAAGPEKYDETAAAMIAQLRYGSGVPFKRLERLEGNLGIPLPAATQWAVVEKAGLGLRPAYDEYIRQAARGEVVHNDDTGMRILRLAREPADPRTGIFTSGIVSLGPGWKIALYFSGAKHAGENLAEVLKQRPAGLAPLIQMCDALSWNTSGMPEGVERLLAHCMSHYLDSCIIQSECETDAPGRDGSGVSGTLTPDKASQAFEEREQLGRWPPFSRCRGVESRSPPECLQHVALHLKIGRNVSACGGHRCMAEVISNHRNIDPCLQKGNGTTVSHDVWSDSALS
jgi:rubredoxin